MNIANYPHHLFSILYTVYRYKNTLSKITQCLSYFSIPYTCTLPDLEEDPDPVELEELQLLQEDLYPSVE